MQEQSPLTRFKVSLCYVAKKTNRGKNKKKEKPTVTDTKLVEIYALRVSKNNKPHKKR